MTAAAAASGFVPAAKLSATNAASAEHGQPNVLFLMCDQLNARVLGCYGGPIPTPNLDRLCRAGVRFDEVACTYPLCSPNRASIVTGLYPHTHGIVYNVDIIDYPAIPAPPTEQEITTQDNTIGKLLYKAGYDTHQYGKWHLHGDILPWYQDTYGEHREYAWEMADVFKRVRKRPRSTWMDWNGWALPVSVNPTYKKAAEPFTERWKNYPAYVDIFTKVGRLEFPLREVFDVRVADHAIECLRAVTSKPFFITASLDYPHSPNVVPFSLL